MINYGFYGEPFVSYYGTAKLMKFDNQNRAWFFKTEDDATYPGSADKKFSLVTIDSFGVESTRFADWGNSYLAPVYSLNGISLNGSCIYESQRNYNTTSERHFYLNGIELDFIPKYISENDYVLGADFIHSGGFYSGTDTVIRFPDGHKESAFNNAGSVTWVDGQNRLRGFERGTARAGVFVPRLGSNGLPLAPAQYDFLPDEPLVVPTGWATDHLVAPGTISPQLGIAVNLTTGMARPFVATRKIQLAVDTNRDGTIKLASEDASDATFVNPYRFWLNDDDDTEVIPGPKIPLEVETFPVTTADYTKHLIVSKRNLEDFARLWISIGGLQDAITAGTIQVGLKWKDGYTGTPAINVYASADATGSDSYLTDATGAAAQAQITGDFNKAIKDKSGKQTVDTNGTFIFTPDFWTGLTAANPKKCLLFEGAGTGQGQLVIVLLDQNGNQIGDGPGVWFDLKNIKSMYQRVKVTPRDPSGIPAPFVSATTFDASTTSTQPSDDGYSFAAPADETPTALVFVHGSNIPYEEARWNAETMLKRLWWQGYKGRFVLFYWDTLVGPFDGTLPAPYNLNEYRSWKYGPALNNYVANGLPSGYAKNVIGHSLGNGVLVSALREGMVARNVILMQAAMPASCFDSSAQTLAGLVGVESQVPTPDTASQKGYRGVVEANLNATLSSIYNENDYALGWWVTNQENRKPEVAPNFDLDYYYTWTASGGGQLWKYNAQGNGNPPAVHYFVTDSHESMAFIARSRTTAAGRTTVGGSIGNNLNVGQDTELNFGDQRPDHSGEFARGIQQLGPFYRYIFVRAR